MGYSGRVGSYTYIHSVGSRGSNNPCPSGYNVDTMVMELLFDNSTYKNITFLVCNEKEAGSDLALGLGLGLGLGIPVVVIILIVLYRMGCFPCTERGRIMTENRLIQPIYQVPTEKENIFNMLGSRLHRDFMAGNLTEDLRLSIRSCSKEDLILLENYALEHKKTNIALHIRSEIDRLENTRPAQVPTMTV